MMNFSDMCISEPFAKAVLTSSTVFPWPLTVPQTVVNNHQVNMSSETHHSVAQCCQPSMNGNFPVAISDKPEELRPQNGIVVYYTGVPAFAPRYNQVSNNEVEKTCSGTDGGNSQGKKEKIFPWLTSFSKQCCAAVGNKSVKQLENLLNTYIQHVTPHYNECQKLPNKAFKVKRNINETMVFLHLLYSDLHEPLENGFYHEKMAEVMAMYLDLEITASRRGKDTAKEVYNRLSSSLYTLLDHSDDHILDAVLRTQLVNKHSKHLCGPFLRKVLTELVVRRPLSALTYVRYILAFKLWKNVVAEANEKKAINKLALQRLYPPPKFFQDHDIAKPSSEILPKVPKNKKNSSQFYLQTKLNLKDACRAFFKFCKETNCQEEPVYLPTFSEKSEDVESNGCLSLINDIWSTISNDVSDNMPLLGKSEVFLEDRMFCDDSSLCESEEVFIKTEVPTEKKVESPDSGVCLDEKAKSKRKRSTDGERDKVPDSTYYPDSQELKSGGDESTDVDGSGAETISEAASPEPSSTVSVPAIDKNQRCSETSSFDLHLPENETGKFVEAEPATCVSVESQSSTCTPPLSSDRNDGDCDVKIKQESAEESELPSSSRYQQCLAPYPYEDNVAVEEKLNTLTYQEVLPREDLAELEWRRYSDALKSKTSVDVSLEEQVMDDAEGGRNHHSSANCHLPLKKRKLAASSPTEEPKKGSISDFIEGKMLEEVTRKKDTEEGRFESVQYVPTDTRWRPSLPVLPEENTPADLSRTVSERVPCVERRSHLEELYSAPEVLTSSRGVHKLDRDCQSSSQVTADVPDNLKILAEEAAKIWEKREHETSIQVPYGVYPLQACALDMKASFIPTYSAGRMMSLAEALERQSHKKVEESVIVRNDQYQYYKEQSNGGRIYTNAVTQYHASAIASSSRLEIPIVKDTRYHRVNGDRSREGDVMNKASVAHNGSLYGEHKPIDMSGKSKDSTLPFSRNVCDKSRAESVGKGSSCSKCKLLLSACKGKCGMESVDKGMLNSNPDKVSCCSCRSQSCNGKKCKVVLGNMPQGGASPPNSTAEVREKSKKCSCCKNDSCGGTCRSESNGNAYRPIKSVCQYCKKSGCDTRCWYASSENSKKCSNCQSLTCKGKCKANQNSTNKKSQAQEIQNYPPTAKFAKCHYCKSTCFGTCRLAEKNQSLGNTKCNFCNSVSCKGKCFSGAVCSYCSQKGCSGACKIQHSVDSILGSSSSSAVLHETSLRSNRRRTRNSVQVEQSKVRSTPQEEKSATESKRRKKSISR